MPQLDVDVEGATLAATYSPAGEHVVVAVHGAGSGTRDSFLYRHLHDVLPPAGIGVVTFDRRGDGASTGEPSRGRFELQAEDALAVAEAVGAGRFGMWGFSQGGWVAPLAAARSEHVAFLVLVASAGVTPSEQMMYAVAEQLRRAGYGAEIVSRALALRRAFEAWVHGRRGEGAAELPGELEAASAEPWWPLAFLPSRLPGERGCRLWIEEMDFDPRPIFAQVRAPTLLFYGADDSWTPVGASVDAWRDARPDELDVVVVPEATHELTLPSGALAPQYARTLVEWLVRATGG